MLLVAVSFVVVVVTFYSVCIHMGTWPCRIEKHKIDCLKKTSIFGADLVSGMLVLVP